MSVRVIVNGAQGQMGSLACETLANHPNFNLVAGLSRQDNLAKTIKETQAQIVVDLTRADSVYKNTLTIIEAGAHPVIGTTGLIEQQIDELKRYCSLQKLGGLIVPNFSIGAVLMMRFAAEAAKFLSDVEIIEAHHPKKLDAPSGTALKTAEMIAKVRTHKREELPLHELISGVRGGTSHDIPIHSIRLPGILARQQVVFGHPGETLTITHDTIDRACFMPGLILACQRVSSLDSLYYGLERLLF